MIVLAIVATFGAVFASALVLGANGMRSSPGAFEYRGAMIGAWVVCAAFWLAWWFA